MVMLFIVNKIKMVNFMQFSKNNKKKNTKVVYIITKDDDSKVVGSNWKFNHKTVTNCLPALSQTTITSIHCTYYITTNTSNNIQYKH